MAVIVKGNAHIFGDHVNTDEIIAARYLSSTDMKELGSHCMETLVPEFAQKVAEGDIIVGGRNFGCGSSREHAPWAIKGCGVSCVIATSYARIFYRNAVNIGLPILECASAGQIQAGDALQIDLEKGIVKNITQKTEYTTQRFPEFMQGIMKAGGLLSWIQRKES